VHRLAEGAVGDVVRCQREGVDAQARLAFGERRAVGVFDDAHLPQVAARDEELDRWHGHLSGDRDSHIFTASAHRRYAAPRASSHLHFLRQERT
jgi:hypothetical protein